MISSLEIEHFRCFERFEARDLARINLVVGTNNSGKSSLLEAVELWAAEGGHHAMNTMKAALERRGEYVHATAPPGPKLGFLVRHLFHGHALEPGRGFALTATQGNAGRCLRATIESRHSDEGDRLSLLIWRDMGDGSKGGPEFKLDPDGALSGPVFRGTSGQENATPARMVTTRSLPPGEVAALFGEYVLTDEEQNIVGALQVIEPGIERIALAVGNPSHGPHRTGIFVKCTGRAQRIPIGSMGDGIWRMLALTLALVGTRGGVLLVDEIDTGLHFSVMARMWRLVIETAKRLDVQVFATTHSRDCYESLAMVLREMSPPAGTAAIHRIERDKGRTVVFDEQEIIIAAERGIEVR